MPNYRRSWVPGGTFFFTVRVRAQLSLIDYIDNLRSALAETRLVRPFELQAMVVLPDHLHCIWRLPGADSDNAIRWRQMKAAFCRGVPALESRNTSRHRRGERGIWQRRFWERVLRDENDRRAHLDYIHFNPVKHGYVMRVVDWPYSSFHRYVERGLLSADWGGTREGGIKPVR